MMETRLHAQPKTAPPTSFTPVPGGLLQRTCACGGPGGLTGECEQCDKQNLSLQRSTQNSESETRNSGGVPPIVNEVLSSPGQPLDSETRAFMEPRFGHDFSNVRVHRGAKAAESAQAVNAFAYTVGDHVVLGAGQNHPNSIGGRKLLAHELAHTIQQSSGGQDPNRLSSPSDATEQEAETAAQSISEPGNLQPAAVVDVHLARQVDPSAAAASDFPTATTYGVTPTANATCNPAPGVANTNCSAYGANSWWLPVAYVNNATCACEETPNEPTANCVRKFLQDRLAATPALLKATAAAQKLLEANPLTLPEYEAFVQAFLTPRIYQDHVDAYSNCCCTSGPAPYPAWIGVTTVPLPCSAVGKAIRQFGSCHGTPGKW